MIGLQIRRFVLAPLAAGLLGASPALAQGVVGQVGAEIDGEDGYLLFGAIGGSLSERTRWDVAASRADASTDFSDLRTTALDASLYHDFGNVGLRVGLGGWRGDELVSADEIAVALDLHGTTWTVALETQLRESDFQPVAIDRTITLRNGTQLTIQGRADCAVDDTGLGARVSMSADAWYFSVSGMEYDYDGFGCTFSVPAIDFLRSATRDEFVQFADRLTGLLALGAGRRLLSEAALLDSRIGLSVSRESGARRYSVYFDRVEDLFFDETADTLSAGVGFVLESGNELAVYAGFTAYDTRSDVTFLGVSLLIAP